IAMEQRANIKFCVKLKKTFTETFALLKEVYEDNCLSRTQVYDWFTRFKNGWESIEDDSKSRPKTSIVTLDHPPYSPDLAPCDYFLFLKLKIAVKGTRYNNITDIEAAVTEVLNDISKQDLERSFEMLATRSQRCIDAEGAYFE
ncbi:hypothetical protein X777_07709, partial [Ooceraea biroi]